VKKTTFRPAKNVLGPAIRQMRRSQPVRVSQDDLAGRMAAQGITIDRSAIARIERGQRYILDYEAQAIAKALRVPIERLYRQ